MNRRDRRWLAILEQVEQRGEGWGPSVAQLDAGQDVFGGRVVAGPWVGHEVLVDVEAQPTRRRLLRRRPTIPQPVDAFGFGVEVWSEDSTLPPGVDDPFTWLHSLDDLLTYLEPLTVEWIAPPDAGRVALRLQGCPRLRAVSVGTASMWRTEAPRGAYSEPHQERMPP